MFVCTVPLVRLPACTQSLSFSQHRRGVQKEDRESLVVSPCLVPIEGNLVGVELCPFVFFSLPWLIEVHRDLEEYANAQGTNIYHLV